MRFTSGCLISDEGCFGQFGETCRLCREGRRISPEERKRIDKVTRGAPERIGCALREKVDSDILNMIDNS